MDLWTSSVPVSLLKQGDLEPVAHDHVQTAFECLQRWRVHSLSGQRVALLSHSRSEKVFPDFYRESPVFQFVPIASSLATGHH